MAKAIIKNDTVARRAFFGLLCLLLLVAVWLFWWLGHPEILAFQETYQMFLTTGDYLQKHLCEVGGISMYIGEFLTQYNIYPCLGAGIIGLETLAIAVLVYRMTAKEPGKLRFKSIIPLAISACAALAFNYVLGDENLLPSFAVSIILALSALYIILMCKTKVMKGIATAISLPLLFWCCWTSHYRIPHAFLNTPGFNEERCEVLKYDYLVRNQEWNEIISKAEKKNPHHKLGIQALNLALGKQNWLGDRMFSFYQSGSEGLFSAWNYNSVDCVISSEIAWHLGLINTAFRYSFDSQEAIPDKRKSARFMKRMAECSIVNGNYKVAKKYLNKLKHTTFYRIWAERTEQCLFNDNMVAQHPVYGEKRNVRFKAEFLFTHTELNKILVMLAVESKGRNPLAWDYANAATMLKGDLEFLAGTSHYGEEIFHRSVLPKHHQEAWALIWTGTHPNFEGCPVTISADIQQRTMQFANAFMQSKGQLNGFEQAYNDTYWPYFFRKQQQQSAAAQQQEVDGNTGASAQH